MRSKSIQQITKKSVNYWVGWWMVGGGWEDGERWKREQRAGKVFQAKFCLGRGEHTVKGLAATTLRREQETTNMVATTGTAEELEEM